ncbi:MAG: hypothetical protein NXI32_06105 [bacterium]|nr:hypothetical protein [bacterium]
MLATPFGAIDFDNGGQREMALDTQPANTSFPLVIPTQSEHPTARLVMKNELGEAVQQWLIRQNKCTIGSSASSTLRCQLPGIAPFHALLVVGARQIFVRALAPKVTRDGMSVNELLLHGNDNHFELAGHRFEVTRNLEPQDEDAGLGFTSSNPASAKAQRLKFALARPLALKQRGTQSQASPAEPRNASVASRNDSRWIANLIQSAIEPLECQLQNVLEPLTELQEEARRQRQAFEDHQLRENEDGPARISQAIDSSRLAELGPQLEKAAASHAARIDVVKEHISDLSQQIATLERIIGEFPEPSWNSEARHEADARSSEHYQALQQLQTKLTSLADSVQSFTQDQNQHRDQNSSWQSNVSAQLSGLQTAVEGTQVSCEAISKNAAQQAREFLEQTHAKLDQIADQTTEGLQGLATQNSDQFRQLEQLQADALQLISAQSQQEMRTLADRTLSEVAASHQRGEESLTALSQRTDQELASLANKWEESVAQLLNQGEEIKQLASQSASELKQDLQANIETKLSEHANRVGQTLSQRAPEADDDAWRKNIEARFESLQDSLQQILLALPLFATNDATAWTQDSGTAEATALEPDLTNEDVPQALESPSFTDASWWPQSDSLISESVQFCDNQLADEASYRALPSEDSFEYASNANQAIEPASPVVENEHADAAEWQTEELLMPEAELNSAFDAQHDFDQDNWQDWQPESEQQAFSQLPSEVDSPIELAEFGIADDPSDSQHPTISNFFGQKTENLSDTEEWNQASNIDLKSERSPLFSNSDSGFLELSDTEYDFSQLGEYEYVEPQSEELLPEEMRVDESQNQPQQGIASASSEHASRLQLPEAEESAEPSSQQNWFGSEWEFFDKDYSGREAELPQQLFTDTEDAVETTQLPQSDALKVTAWSMPASELEQASAVELPSATEFEFSSCASDAPNSESTIELTEPEAVQQNADMQDAVWAGQESSFENDAFESDAFDKSEDDAAEATWLAESNQDASRNWDDWTTPASATDSDWEHATAPDELQLDEQFFWGAASENNDDAFQQADATQNANYPGGEQPSETFETEPEFSTNADADYFSPSTFGRASDDALAIDADDTANQASSDLQAESLEDRIELPSWWTADGDESSNAMADDAEQPSESSFADGGEPESASAATPSDGLSGSDSFGFDESDFLPSIGDSPKTEEKTRAQAWSNPLSDLLDDEIDSYASKDFRSQDLEEDEFESQTIDEPELMGFAEELPPETNDSLTGSDSISIHGQFETQSIDSIELRSPDSQLTTNTSQIHEELTEDSENFGEFTSQQDDDDSHINLLEGIGETDARLSPEVGLVTEPLQEISHQELSDAEHEESVEQYMERLLSRMRGESQAVQKPPTSDAPVEGESSRGKPQAPRSRTVNHQEDEQASSEAVYEPAQPEQTLSDQVYEEPAENDYQTRPNPNDLKREPNQSFAAMRELANSSARSAIHKSTRKRQVTGVALKGTIAVIALIVGATLLTINGLNLSIGLIAALAAFMVSAIWGYDAIASLSPVLQNHLVLKPNGAELDNANEANASSAESDEPQESNIVTK